MDEFAEKIYGDRVRTRVCGLCWEGQKLLLVNHFGIYGHDFWSPPGGGVEFGQTAASNLIREFREETGLDIQTGEFLFACEFIRPPLHAIELFFAVKSNGGKLISGYDPEMNDEKQVISEARYMSTSEIDGLPENHKHGLFKLAKKAEKVNALTGYLKI